MRLSNLIYRATKKHKVSSRLFTAILRQESAYKSNSIHRACGLKPKEPVKLVKECVWQDFGMSQINYSNVIAYKFDVDKLLFDDEYSINAGAKVLKWFKDRYEKKNPKYWWVRYNCGTNPNINRPTCNEYKELVERWM